MWEGIVLLSILIVAAIYLGLRWLVNKIGRWE